MASKPLAGTKTHQHLKDAFAGESQANRRYLYFAKVADVEGRPDVAGLFKDTADGETGHAHGHLDYLKAVGDPATGLPIGNTEKNLRASVAGETHEYETMYPGMAKDARAEDAEELTTVEIGGHREGGAYLARRCADQRGLRLSACGGGERPSRRRPR